MKKAVDYRKLNKLLAEYHELSNKVQPTKADAHRMAFLQSATAAVRDGASIVDHDTQFRGWLAAVSVDSQKRRNEKRDVEGAPMLNHIGTYSGLGFFVPTEFFENVFESMKAYDALLDKDLVTMIRTANGRPMPVPTMDDTSNDASVVGESVGASSVDIGAVNHVVLGSYSYMSRYWTVSLELFQDLEASFSSVQLFQSFTSKALSRGIGRDLMVGNGSGKTLGLIPSLENAGVTPVVAVGSAANTGGSESGATSLGSADFANALKSLDTAYSESPNVAWLMNRSTLYAVEGIVTKQGLPLGLVKYDDDGKPSIMGIPVRICPSMDNIGVSAVPVILGDCSYWATRIVTPGAEDDLGIQVFREAPGLIENGKVALRSKVRAHGALLWNGSGPAPFVVLQNHS